MPRGGKRPCRFCRRWFRPAPQQRGRLYACPSSECQALRKQTNQVQWSRQNPAYFRGRGEVHRAWREANPERVKEASQKRRAEASRASESQKRAERRKSARIRLSVEQDACAIQLVGTTKDGDRNLLSVEQDACLTQSSVIAGLALTIALSVEQDACLQRLRTWHDRGRRLLRGILHHARSKEAG